MTQQKTYRLVLLGFFICLELVLMLTPLGYVPIGPIRATTMHIPVILAGLLLGKKEGALIGLVFGLTSVMINTLTPTVASFVFSPFYSVGTVSGNGMSLVIALVPRILLGFGSGWLHETIQTKHTAWKIAAISVGMTVVHTLLVMGGIYVFFGEAYAAAKEVPYELLGGVIMGVITTNGVLEAILAGVVCVAVYQAAQQVMKRR